RSKRDWSSDVCSSDLASNGSPLIVWSTTLVGEKNFCATSCWLRSRTCTAATPLSVMHLKTLLSGRIAAITRGGLNDAWESQVTEIGRASCRERVWDGV